ncbi:unnamed protein product, partial [Clonostachys solani]
MPPSPSRSGKQPIPAPKLPQKKTIACRPCHARKIRCSGNKPCNNCARVSDCIYPTRDRQVRVHQSFLDRLLQENADLRALQRQPEQSQRKTEQDTWNIPAISQGDQESAENQSIQGSDWFTHIRTSDTPIWIGEISDSAFATRFRQFASFSQTPCHIPRTQFVSDEALHSLATTFPPPTWPSLSRARLLVETALRFLRHSYHIVRRSEVFSTLRAADFNQISLHSKAKLWALFAIGELRSSKCLTATGHLPGLAYFAMAGDAIRMINERPQIDVIETVLLLLLIVATRPVLLFVFRHHIDERSSTGTELPIPDQTQSIVEACIGAARQSCDLLSQCWVNGEFHIFDYFHVQHLFSAAVILAIAGALGRETSQEEIDEFNLAAGFLQQLEQNGNYAAMEFYAHVQEIQSTLRMLRSAVLHNPF